MSGLSLYGSGLTITEAQGPNYYLGTWNASTNTPTLASSVAPAGPAGSYYIVSVAGTTTLNGISDWTVGDWAIWNGSVWQKLEGGATAITVGSTAISGGTSGRVLYDNGGTLGEYTITGTAGNVVMSGSPTLTGTTTVGVVAAGDGTSSAPSYSFASELGTGFYRSAANKMVYATNAHAVVMLGDNIIRMNGNGMLGFASAGNDPTGSQSVGMSIAVNGLISVDTGTLGNGLGAIGAVKFTGGPALSASYPMWKRNAAAWNARLADDSADADITAATVTAATYTAPAGNMTVQSASNSNLILNAAGAAALVFRTSGTSSLEIDSSQNVYQRNGVFLYYGTTTNSGDVYTLTPARAVSAYAKGQMFYAEINSTNTTTTPTLNVSALGARTIVKRANTALAAGDLVANGIYLFVQQGTNVQVINPTVP